MAYSLSIPTVSPVVIIYPTMETLLAAIRELVENEDDVSLTVTTVEMTPEDVEALPEFDGY